MNVASGNAARRFGRVFALLERRGIVSSSGSACAAGSDEASHVLLALGVAHDDARTAVRFTLPHGLRASLDPVADAVVDAVSAVGSRG